MVHVLAFVFDFQPVKPSVSPSISSSSSFSYDSSQPYWAFTVAHLNSARLMKALEIRRFRFKFKLSPGSRSTASNCSIEPFSVDPRTRCDRFH